MKRRNNQESSYSFGDYQEQYGDVSPSADAFALKDKLIDKMMHQSVHDAVMATLEDDDKDDTFIKVI